jgi:hypothetical protein
MEPIHTLPACLPHTGDLASEAQEPEADSTHPKPAKISSDTAADPAAVIVSGGELLFRGRLISQRQS